MASLALAVLGLVLVVVLALAVLGLVLVVVLALAVLGLVLVVLDLAAPGLGMVMVAFLYHLYYYLLPS